MTILQYLSAFRLYGADVLLLALGVTLVTALLKKTLLKNATKKLYLFLPFLIGLLFWCVYRAFADRNFLFLTENFPQTLEGAFACGCAATLYYVVYEQFFRAKTDGAAEPLAPLLEGFVPEEKREEAARALDEGATGLEGDALRAFVSQTLAAYAEENATEAELTAAAALIAEFIERSRSDKAR